NKGNVEQAGSPQEIYRKPATEFVANFIGGANVVPARSLSQMKFKLLGEEYDFIEDRVRGNGIGSGKVILRPESIRLDFTRGRHKAKVLNATFLGSRVTYDIECNGVKLSADQAWTGREEIYKAGETVNFDVESSALHFLP
ncbi:MAG: TOBE domain-containing protein, partial [Bdellovibrionia bacterium]